MIKSLMGIQIIEDHNLTRSETKSVDRSMKERFLSWPWKPWIKRKLITEIYPDPNIYKLPDGVWIMHPSIAIQVKSAINDE